MIEEHSTIKPLHINTQPAKNQKQQQKKIKTKKKQQKTPKTIPTYPPELTPAFFTSTLNRNTINMSF